jgi:hypothetical protein
LISCSPLFLVIRSGASSETGNGALSRRHPGGVMEAA